MFSELPAEVLQKLPVGAIDVSEERYIHCATSKEFL